MVGSSSTTIAHPWPLSPPSRAWRRRPAAAPKSFWLAATSPLPFSSLMATGFLAVSGASPADLWRPCSDLLPPVVARPDLHAARSGAPSVAGRMDLGGSSLILFSLQWPCVLPLPKQLLGRWLSSRALVVSNPLGFSPWSVIHAEQVVLAYVSAPYLLI